jgi:hypothetical protein
MHLDLNALDVDGDIRESAEAAGLDRSDFIKRGVLAGGGLLVGGAAFNALLDPAQAAISKKRSAKNDVKILNYALTLEFLEAEFYKQAVANNAFGANAQLALFAQTTARHEAAHVKFLRTALKSAAVKKPKLDFGDTVTDPAKFAATAQVLEDTGVRAYLGQVGNVKQAAVLGAAGTILTVEARHAAWIRYINSGGQGAPKVLPAPASFDTPASEKAILAAVKKTGFLG